MPPPPTNLQLNSGRPRIGQRAYLAVTYTRLASADAPEFSVYAKPHEILDSLVVKVLVKNLGNTPAFGVSAKFSLKERYKSNSKEPPPQIQGQNVVLDIAPRGESVFAADLIGYRESMKRFFGPYVDDLNICSEVAYRDVFGERWTQNFCFSSGVEPEGSMTPLSDEAGKAINEAGKATKRERHRSVPFYFKRTMADGNTKILSALSP